LCLGYTRPATRPPAESNEQCTGAHAATVAAFVVCRPCQEHRYLHTESRLTVLDVKSRAWTGRASHRSTICYSTVVIHAPSRLTCWFVKARTGAWRGSWIGSRPRGGCWGGCQWIPGCDTSAELTETALHYFSGYASWTWRASSKNQKSGPYVSEREDSRWFKIRNPEYS